MMQFLRVEHGCCTGCLSERAPETHRIRLPAEWQLNVVLVGWSQFQFAR